MKILCISDTHNQHKGVDLLGVEDIDIVCYAGDFTNFGKKHEITRFVHWFTQIPVKYRILVAGNHELSLDDKYVSTESCKKTLNIIKKEVQSIVKNNDKLIYLENSSVVIDGIHIYGSPHTLGKQATKWAFQLETDKEVHEAWAKIPSTTDVLITHTPPYKIMDKNHNEEHKGCPVLANVVKNRIKPRIHLFGHIHCNNGIKERGGTTYINASVVGTNHDIMYEPIKIEIKN